MCVTKMEMGCEASDYYKGERSATAQGCAGYREQGIGQGRLEGGENGKGMKRVIECDGSIGVRQKENGGRGREREMAGVLDCRVRKQEARPTHTGPRQEQ